MLPGPTQHVTINESVMQVNALSESSLAKFCSVTTQQKVRKILGALRAIQRGHSPTFTTWGGDVVLKKINDETIPLFLFVDGNGELEEEGELPVRGKEAAMQRLQAAREAHAVGTLDLRQLQVLTTYDFLLSPTENELVQSWLGEIWRSAGLAGATAINEAKRSATASSASSSSMPKAKKQKSRQPQKLTTSQTLLRRRELWVDQGGP